MLNKRFIFFLIGVLAILVSNTFLENHYFHHSFKHYEMNNNVMLHIEHSHSDFFENDNRFQIQLNNNIYFSFNLENNLKIIYNTISFSQIWQPPKLS